MQICNKFSDVFNENYSITSLANNVKFIKKLPRELMITMRIVKHFRTKLGMDYYEGYGLL
ncbi:hypothetical protein HanIR_Chr02g0099781 [Helianthus annuus]|nr:hypothetical protein HanIR_Chr02g0099781 [Helianthus annuus]